MLIGVQTFHLIKTVQKCKKQQNFEKLSHFRIPHPQISFKQYSNICENVLYFRGAEKSWRFFAEQFNFKIFKIGQFWFFLIFSNYHTL